MADADFKKIGEVKASDASDVVLSELHKDGKLKGYIVSKFVNTEKYTGFAKGGVTIPEERIVEFLKLFPKDLLQDALEE